MLTEKKFVLLIASAVFVFCAVIFSAEHYYSQKNYPGQWFLSFSDPSSNSLDFEIKNESLSGDFSWTLTNNKKIIIQEKVSVAPDESLEIKPAVDYSTLHGKWIINVTDSQKNKKNIYKIYP